MRQAVSAILIAAGVLAASSALAQQRGPATDGARGGERFAMFSAEDRAAMTDARIAALRAGLRLTPEQEKNWPAVETAIRDLSKQRSEMRERMREVRRDTDPIARLRAAADAMGERSTGLKRLADASEPLYRSLDEGQKRRLSFLTRQAMHPQFGPRRGPR
jgi:zinc resistance-associated protein